MRLTSNNWLIVCTILLVLTTIVSAGDVTVKNPLPTIKDSSGNDVPIDSGTFITDSPTIDKYFSLVSNTDQCLSDCRTTYQIKNGGVLPMVVDASSFWYEFRDNDMLIRKSTLVGGLNDFHLWISEWKPVTRNFTNWTKQCTAILGTNWTYDCSWVISDVQKTTKDEVVETNADKLNVTLMPSQIVNLTIIGRKNPYQNVDNIPVLVTTDGTVAATKYAWWNSSWNNRVCLNGLTNQNSSNESRDLELFHINLSSIVGFNGCSNNTGVKCVDGRMVINDTASNFQEVLFNVSNATRFRVIGASGGIAEEGRTTLNLYFMLNSTKHYTPSTYNITPCFFYNNTNASISANHVGGIVTELDSFETGINVAAGNTPFSSVSIGTFSTNASLMNGWKPDGNVTAIPSGAATRDSLRDASGTSTNYVVYIYNAGGNWIRGVGIGPNDEGSSIVGTCTNGRIGQDSTCVTANSTNGTGWHSIKATTIESYAGTQIMYYVNGKAAGIDASSTLPPVHIGEEASAAGSNLAFDYFIGSLWNLNLYDYPSNFTLGIVENVTPTPPTPVTSPECVINSRTLNATGIEQDSQVSEINVTSNRTNVINVDASFFYNGINTTPDEFNTPNDTATNNTLFRAYFNVSIVAGNGTNISADWFAIICYLNNGSIRSFNLTNGGQLAGFAYREQKQNFTNNLFETDVGNYTLNLSLYKTVSQVNTTLVYNASSANGTLLVTNSIGGDLNSSTFGTNITLPLVVVNNTAQGFYWAEQVLYRNGTIKLVNSSQQNQTLFFGCIPINVESQNVTEGSPIIINASLFKLLCNAGIGLQIAYNKTNTTPALIVNTSTLGIWQDNLTTFGLIDPVNLQNNFTATWNLTSGGVSVLRELFGSHIITQFNLTACNTSLTNVSTMNFSLRDELTFGLVNGTMQHLWTVYNPLTPQFNRTFGFSFGTNGTPVSDARLCIFPNLTLTVFGQIVYGASGYGTRTRQLFPPFNISSVSQLFNLFLLNSGNATKITFTVIDETTQPVTAVIVISKQDPVTGLFAVVDSIKTGVGGTVSEYMQQGANYKFQIYTMDGVLRKTDIFIVTETSYVFKIVIGTTTTLNPFLNVLGLTNATGNRLTCVNSTQTAYFDFNDSNQQFTQFCMRVINTTSGAWNAAFSYCTTNDTGEITSGQLPDNNTYTATAIAQQPNHIWVVDACDMDTTRSIHLAKEGLFLSILLLIVLVSAGIWNPAVALMLIIPWFILVTFTGLLHVGWASAIGVILVGIFIVLQMNP